MPILTPALVDAILQQYRLPLRGLHGLSHWARVLENGRLLAARTGARLEVVELFALFHDSRRLSDNGDPFHGARGAKLAAQYRGQWFDLPDEDFRLLQTACTQHTFGRTQADPIVQVCWDADRLDLNRVGILPRSSRLCTAAARDPDVLAWANERAARRVLPGWVASEWGIDPANLD
jgi:uncharacterized protein